MKFGFILLFTKITVSRPLHNWRYRTAHERQRDGPLCKTCLRLLFRHLHRHLSSCSCKGMAKSLVTRDKQIGRHSTDCIYKRGFILTIEFMKSLLSLCRSPIISVVWEMDTSASEAILSKLFALLCL